MGLRPFSTEFCVSLFNARSSFEHALHPFRRHITRKQNRIRAMSEVKHDARGVAIGIVICFVEFLANWRPNIKDSVLQIWNRPAGIKFDGLKWKTPALIQSLIGIDDSLVFVLVFDPVPIQFLIARFAVWKIFVVGTS